MSIFIAVNGDDVGTKIGEAIANDDHEGLSSVTNSINESHDMIGQWVESVGGRTITSSGDEGLYEIPEEAFSDLEEIKQKYSDMSGHTVTIGMGSSMSEASKALIFGKLNDKDQIVEYSDEVESFLREEDVDEDEIGEEMPDEGMGEEDLDEMSEEDVETEDEYEEIPEEAEEGDYEEDEGEEIDSDEELGEEIPEDQDGIYEYGDEEGSDGQYDGQEESDIEDEYQEGEEALEEDMYDDAEESGEEDYDANEMMGDMLEGSMEEDEEYSDEMPEDEMSPEMGMEDEIPEEGMEEPMDDSQMVEDEMQAPMDSPEEEPGEQMGADDQELKMEIFESLNVFKENRDMLEQTKQSNPILYQATISMLRSMIEMAKRLGYADAGMEQQMPEDEMSPEMGMEQPEIAEPPMGKSEKKRSGRL